MSNSTNETECINRPSDTAIPPKGMEVTQPVKTRKGYDVLLISDKREIHDELAGMVATEPEIHLKFCGEPSLAFEQAAELKPWVILVDLAPCGLKTVRLLKDDPRIKEVPLMVLHDEADIQLSAQACTIGANEALQKWPDPRVVAAIVAALADDYKEFQSKKRAEESIISAPKKQGFKFRDMTIQRALGSGSTGEVYLAHHEKLNVPVALKVMNFSRQATEESAEPGESPEDHQTLRQRFLQEAKLASRVDDPNVVKLHESGEHQGRLYIAYEYIDGGNLNDLMDTKQARRCEIERAVEIATNIAAGLAAANKLGIMHRDIKPENILMTQSGDAKIADFGIAKKMYGSAIMDLTQKHTVVGTPNYISPERVTGIDIDIRSDLYSLGVVLYEMLTGEVPFVEDSPIAALMAHVHKKPPEPIALRHTIPEKLNQICVRLLQKRPEQRYASPEDLLVELKTMGA